MKKIAKKLNYLMKVFLVFGMLFNNLSGLAVVFADELDSSKLGLAINEDKLVLSYTGEILDTDQVKLDISEEYTYIDESTDAPVETSSTITGSDLLTEGGYVIDSKIISGIVFDGTYEATISVYNETNGEEIGEVTVTKEYTHDSGMGFSLVDANDKPISKDSSGKYTVSKSSPSVKVIGVLLPGGLKPTDNITYNDVVYPVSEALGQSYYNTFTFEGHLYGDYTLPVEVDLIINDEGVSYTDEYKILYESYEENSNVLNDAATILNLDSKYEFISSSPNGEVYVYLTSSNTVLDLYNIAKEAIGTSNIDVVISNSSSDNLILDAGDNVDDYLSSINIDNSTVLKLIDGDLSITFKAIVFGDIDDDNDVDEDDLLALIDEAIGVKDANPETSDLYGDDDKVNTLDVIYLNEVIKNDDWNVGISTSSATISSKLELDPEELVTGDEFTISYVLEIGTDSVSGIAGLIDYDGSMFELVSVEAYEDFIGNNNDGKFLYFGEQSLSAKTTTATTSSPTTSSDDVETTDYQVLTLTFKALKAGSSDIKITDAEYFNGNVYYTGTSEVAKTVTVNASDDNSLSSLKVGDNEITLKDDVLEYSIDVANDVTSVSVEAIANNIGAKVTSVVPASLEEGENIITITVVAENGDEKIYTIKVNREKASEEETTEETTSSTSYQSGSNSSSGDKVIEDKTKNDDKSKDDGKNKDEDIPKTSSKPVKIIVIILILLAIAGLIWLIFRDEDDDEKKSNKDINKYKKPDSDFKNNKSNNNTNKNDKKER